MSPGLQVFEEEIDDVDPSEQEIEDYAKWIGLDPAADTDLLWIAREGLKAPLPEEWKPCRSEDGDLYYFNFVTGKSSWDHPCDSYYKNLYQEEKRRRSQPAGPATARQQHLFNHSRHTTNLPGAYPAAAALATLGVPLLRPPPSSVGNAAMPGSTPVALLTAAARVCAPHGHLSYAHVPPAVPLLQQGQGHVAQQLVRGASSSPGSPIAAPLSRRVSEPPGLGPSPPGAGGGSQLLTARKLATAPGAAKKVTWQDMVSTDPQPTAGLPARPTPAVRVSQGSVGISSRQGSAHSALSPALSRTAGTASQHGGSSYAQQMQIYKARMAAALAMGDGAPQGGDVTHMVGEEGAELSDDFAEPSTHADTEHGGSPVQMKPSVEPGQGARAIGHGPLPQQQGAATYVGNPNQAHCSTAAPLQRVDHGMDASGTTECCAARAVQSNVGCDGSAQAAAQATLAGGSSSSATPNSILHEQLVPNMVPTAPAGAAASSSSSQREASKCKGSKPPEQHSAGVTGEVPALQASQRVGRGGQHSMQRAVGAAQPPAGGGGCVGGSGSALLDAAWAVAGDRPPPQQAVHVTKCHAALPTEPAGSSHSPAPGESNEPGKDLRQLKEPLAPPGEQQHASDSTQRTTAVPLNGDSVAEHIHPGVSPDGKAQDQQCTEAERALREGGGAAGNSQQSISSTSLAHVEQHMQRAQAGLERQLAAEAAADADKARTELLKERARRQQQEAAEAQQQLQVKLEARHLTAMESSLQSMKENVREINRLEAQGLQLLQSAGLQLDKGACYTGATRGSTGGAWNSRVPRPDSTCGGTEDAAGSVGQGGALDGELDKCLQQLRQTLSSFAL